MTDEPKKIVMLVDDDAFLLQMYAMKFTSEGFAVQSCKSVNEALTVLRSGVKPDAIAFDITMPEHDGFFLIQKINDEHLAPGAKKIALTNQQSEAEQTKATELGVDQYIIKATMIPSEVVNTVRAALNHTG